MGVTPKQVSGTTFTARPVSTEPALPEGNESLPKQVLPGIRLLFVEDHDAVRRTVSSMLEIAGAEVTAVHSATEALEFLQKKPLDIVVTDLGLPDLDGGQLIARAREFTDIPIVLLSGLSSDTITKCLVGNGKPDAIIPKPMQFQTMAETILTQLELYKTRKSRHAESSTLNRMLD